MDMQLVAGLLLNFAGMAGAVLFRSPRYNWSVLSHQIGWLLLLLGPPMGLLAIFLLIQSRGWGYGLLLWFGSGGLSNLFLMFLPEGLRTLLGIGAAVGGLTLFAWTFA